MWFVWLVMRLDMMDKFEFVVCLFCFVGGIVFLFVGVLLVCVLGLFVVVLFGLVLWVLVLSLICLLFVVGKFC